MSQVRRAFVRSFLIEFKKIVSSHRVYIIQRRVNKEALTELGLTRENVKDEILSLSVADYCSGPEADKDRPGDIWVFGINIDEKEVYLKLKIVEKDEIKIATCISIHPALYPLSFPFRPKGRGC